jgi:hypothetical protein
VTRLDELVQSAHRRDLRASRQARPSVS